MNILVIGITGLFGSHLAREFSALGKIHGLRRSNTPQLTGNLNELDIHWLEGDLLDITSLTEAMQGMDLVVHAAGKVSFSPKEENELFKINHQGTANVVNAMLSAEVKKLVYVSSIAALGLLPDQEEYNEEAIWVDDSEQTAYALSKYRAEVEVWRGEQEGLEVLVVNPSVLLVEAAYSKSSAAIYTYVRRRSLFYPKGSINYIDVRDAATLTRSLVEKNAWGQRFILSKEGMPYSEFFTEVARVFGVKAPKWAIPDWGISLLFPILGVLRSLGLGRSYPLTRQVAKNAQRNCHYQNQKVQSYVAFTYRSLEETLHWAKSASIN
ncbi:MAG: NAD-dependent epimerase/dehydratase family protein [Cyclobacteriaceae bacterium]|nr:NAD-dependent epimerase/dehydratase family protein [Cyclobacteriaceae bacterium]